LAVGEDLVEAPRRLLLALFEVERLHDARLALGRALLLRRVVARATTALEAAGGPLERPPEGRELGDTSHQAKVW
jgi:hypothetical protein